jgi:hypothetical protein
VADALVAAPPQALPYGPVWGDDDALRVPSQYEPLDWLTLLRLLGWRPTVASWSDPALDAWGHDVVVVASDPEQMPSTRRDRLAERLRRDTVLVVRPAGSNSGADFHGRRLAWVGPGGHTEWSLDVDLKGRDVAVPPGAEVWATFDGRPVVVAERQGGSGVMVTTGLGPGSGWAPPAVAVLKRVLTHGCPVPAAWLDLAGTLVLRMDDPGGAPNVHLRSWSYRRLTEAEWHSIGDVLRLRGAQMTVGYTPGWLDDGDAKRATVLVGGTEPSRRRGAVYQSSRVVHVDRAGHAPGRVNDYTSEYRGIERLRAGGLVSAELHGYTHIHPDVRRWARAPDRYDDVGWYREFTPESDTVLATRAAGEHPLLLGADLLKRTFGVRPTTLVCPGDGWTPLTLHHAHQAGLRLVTARGLALRDDGRFCWCAGVATMPLDAPAAGLFAAELPVICRFHDREPATLGVEWFAEALDEWRRAGARRLIDFRELSSALALRLRLLRDPVGEWRLRLGGDGGGSLLRPVPVVVRVPGSSPPAEIRVERSGSDLQLPVQTLEHGIGRVMLPPTASAPRG